MTVENLPDYLKQHWSEIRGQLLSGAYKPQPVKRVETPNRMVGYANSVSRLLWID